MSASSHISPACRIAALLFIVLFSTSCGWDEAQSLSKEDIQAEISIVSYSDQRSERLLIDGVLEGLGKRGLVHGKNLAVNRIVAEYDFTNLPALMEELDRKEQSLIIVLTTPVLKAAMGHVVKTPVVFADVTDPVAVGAGKDQNNHLPNITGIASPPPVRRTMEFILNIKPGASLVATCFNPDEPNSVIAFNEAKEFLNGLYVDIRPEYIGPDSDLLKVMRTLVAMNPDAIWLPDDNTLARNLDSAVASVTESIPIVLNDVDHVKYGTVAGFGLDRFAIGIDVGRLAATIIEGEDPAQIPFGFSAPRQTVMNYEEARRIGLSIPLGDRKNVIWTGTAPPLFEE